MWGSYLFPRQVESFCNKWYWTLNHYNWNCLNQLDDDWPKGEGIGAPSTSNRVKTSRRSYWIRNRRVKYQHFVRVYRVILLTSQWTKIRDYFSKLLRGQKKNCGPKICKIFAPTENFAPWLDLLSKKFHPLKSYIDNKKN